METLRLTVIAIILSIGYCQSDKECISGASYLYTGKRSLTKLGHTCQRWDTGFPHKVKKIPQDGGDHNYCRNPDRDPRGTWCYTTDPAVRWEYCDLPKCESKVLVVWAGYNAKQNSSIFDHAKADPEYSSQNNVPAGGMDVEVHKNSIFKAVETDEKGEKIFFTDLKDNYFGIMDVKSSAIERHLQGKVGDIHSIAQDYVTKNFYWTDCKTKSVWVADKDFKAQFPIYNTEPYKPQAIAVLQKHRKLVFSTYVRKDSKVFDTQIIMTDLAGKDAKVLFRYPDVIEVTGLAADDERIYWTDYLGYASKILSCRFDGSDKTEHYFQKSSELRDIAVHEDYIYVSDSQKRYNYFDYIRYHVQILRKGTNQIFTFSRPDLPHGIAILADKSSPARTLESNICEKTCGGICLPNQKGFKCVCSPGYKLQPKTGKCVPNIVNDEYLLALDDASGEVYQIPLSSKGEFSVVHFGKTNHISTMTTDVSTGTVYMYDSDTSDFKMGRVRFALLNKDAKPLGSSVTGKVKDIKLDPVTKDIFYVNENNDIAFMNRYGKNKKVIVENKETNSDVKALAVDSKQKMIYWTDTMGEQGSGKVIRCRFDGSGKQVVLDNLNLPYGIDIDYERNKLYVMDSKDGSIYEIPLMKLIAPVPLKKYKRNDLMEYLYSEKYFLTKLKVHRGFAYISDERKLHLLRYKLGATGPKALVNFGPSVFFKASSLSVYSRSFTRKYIKRLPNPCLRKKCKSSCLALSKKKASCI
uniref:low-density lipoprotein receptor-related protein 4-like n=1 Tax=Styela clava TaxID=7725 RepID=UPI00193AA886|nr:low-density lipoprotein receptor-related protein 4-like [Styela clava]